jgi:two-component system cell cycle response regulator DivK
MTKRILVVEDQGDLHAILRDLLTASGYHIIEAVDGVEGVAKARSESPDLVLMDIQLPVLDGYDATRQIKALPGLAATLDDCGEFVHVEGRRGESTSLGLRRLRHEAL